MQRRDHLAANWDQWLVSDGDAASVTTESLQLTLRPIDQSAGRLKADWWKAGLVHPARMASDGVFGEGGDNGMELIIRGLSPGRHSLATFHNSIWDDKASSIEIRVRGKSPAVQVQPTRRARHDDDVASGYVEFTTSGDEEIVVHIIPRGNEGGDAAGRVILNGVRIDGPNPNLQASRPGPAPDDEHVNARPTLRWRPAAKAIAHDVYLGTNRDAVDCANKDSPEYVGRVSQAEHQTDASNPFAEYYWRVDEVFGDGGENIVKGQVWRFAVRRLAFPDAEGYGRFARGGRGGRVMEVTNLDDDGPGSLRAAVEAEGPRTIVFTVSGLITLQSRLVIKNPYITIAGQTAPGKGVCIRKYPLGLGGTHDAIVRHIRVRPGGIAGVTLDGMGMAGSDHSIIDHASISWSQDEAFSSRAAKNITLQRTLISEALNEAGHKNYPPGTQHGYAASIGGMVGSFHHNLLAHCAGRNWSLAGGLDLAGRHTAWLDIRNNVIYNWKHRTTDGGAAKVQFVNNYYKPGPATRYYKLLNPERDNVAAFGPQDYYVLGNIMEGVYQANETLAGVTEPEPYENFIVNEPFFSPHVDTHRAEDVFAFVLSDVGCTQPTLDEHDRRVIEETLNGTAGYEGSRTGLPGLPDSEQDVGGWEEYPEVRRDDDFDSDRDGMPNWWEEAHRLDPHSAIGDFSDSNADADGDQFTNLEEYLNWMAEPHVECYRNGEVSVDLRALARGFTEDPKFTISDAQGGSVRLDPTGAAARFMPAANGPAIGSISMTVRDSKGATMSRTIGVRVVQP